LKLTVKTIKTDNQFNPKTSPTPTTKGSRHQQQNNWH
jgi:hypothetical protein